MSAFGAENFWDVPLLNICFFKEFESFETFQRRSCVPEVRSSRVLRCPERDRVPPASFHSDIDMILFILIIITIIILIIFLLIIIIIIIIIAVNSKAYLLFCLLVPLRHLEDVLLE